MTTYRRRRGRPSDCRSWLEVQPARCLRRVGQSPENPPSIPCIAFTRPSLSTHSPDTPSGLVVMSEPSPRAIPEPGVPCVPTRSPGREVYECLEIRQQILGLLDKHSLTQFMRIEKKCMFSVAQELYYSMSYTWVRSHMAMTTVGHDEAHS